MSSDLGNCVGAFITGTMIIMAVSVPLAIWKLVDIAIWLYHHVHIGVTR